MFFAWLKNFMPRSLYGRAAAILIVPILLLQFVVTVVFIQRHYDGVSTQMSQSIALEMALLVERVNQAPDLAQANAAVLGVAEPLALRVMLPAEPAMGTGANAWFDISSRTAQRALHDNVTDITDVRLVRSAAAQIWLETEHGLMQVSFNRRRVAASNPHQLLVIMGVLGALMSLISYIFLRNQLRPIKRLAHAASEFGKGRIVTYHTSGAIEVRAAGNAFLDMRNRIQRQSQSRTMMLSGVSHDLRTPLTRLKLGLSMIDDTAEAAPLLRDVEDMNRLVDAFLDYAKSDAGEDPIQVNIAEFMAQIVEDAQRAGQTITLVTGEDASVSLRPVAVRRALENLISNAKRFGTRAQVSYAIGPKSLRLTVEDDGPGIPIEQREEAIRPFAQLDPARNQNRGVGVGLGLSIVSDIARSHGGTLRLEQSETLGGLRADLVLAR